VVHDSGIGVSREEQAQLFTKFFRGRNRVVADTGGTGLGLVIAKAIIERHNGRIEVASVPGEGTHFRVVLPIQAGA
jgi:signal transduction histidine kinase